MTEAIRAFIAIDLSDEAKARLSQAIDSLSRRGVSAVRWVRPEGMHLTLKFLGDIDPSVVGKATEGIRLASQDVGPFALALSHPGAFPSLANPQVLWVGLVGDLDRLHALHQLMETQMEHLGFPLEKRRFSPHVTLGRVRQGTRPEERRRLGDAFSRISVGDVAPWRVGVVKLIRSTLTPAGAIYAALAHIPLPEG